MNAVSRGSARIGSLLLALQLLPGAAGAQSILTVAGGATDDGRPATAAGLNLPMGAAFDAAGNLYIADYGSNRVRKVEAATGNIWTIAGNGDSGYSGDGGAATAASLNLPSGVAVDAAGNVYIADSENHRIRRVAAGSGTISTAVGNGNGGFSGDGGPAASASLSYPADLAFDAAGNLYIADYGNHRIRKVSAGSGLISTVAGNGTPGFSGDGLPAVAASLNQPADVTVDGAGNLYIADYGNHRIRRVAAGSGTISTVAGNGASGFAGDGGPASQASLKGPNGVVVDGAGTVYIADTYNNRIRKVAAGSGTISTYAGNGTRTFGGDGGPATAAGVNLPFNVVLDGGGNPVIADTQNDRIRLVDAVTGVISTIAGGASARGDGGPATAASLNRPYGAAVDAAGNAFIADTNSSVVRKVQAGTGIISTIAGSGQADFGGDGGPAAGAALNKPYGVGVDGAGNVYIADTYNNRIRKIAAGTGVITTIGGSGAQGYSGDGGPATAAALYLPASILVDGGGNVFFSDSNNHRVRRIAAGSGTISTVAGNGSRGFSGDGGSATAASLNGPRGLAFDGAGNLYVVDANNNRVRRVSTGGTITTVAGNGTAAFSGDGGPATAASLSHPFGVAVDAGGNLLIADAYNDRIRKVTAAGATISTIAGTGTQGFAGDGGAAASASLNSPFNVTVDNLGNVFVCDVGNNRLRAISGCAGVTAPPLLAPADGASQSGSTVTLAWSPVGSAFRFDLYLDTANPPARLLAADLGFATATPFRIPPAAAGSFTAANLVPGRTYYWKVVAKGDPFCSPRATASSAVRSFTVAPACTAPGAVTLTGPGDGATGVASPATLSWQAASGAGSYDVFLGSSIPPSPAASGVAGTSWAASGLTAGATYYWSVKARASCDATKTTPSAVRSFKVAGGCSAPGALGPLAPANGATGVAANATISWSASPNASGYDLFLGDGWNPPLWAADLRTTSAQVSGLAAGVTYHWRVIARTSCDASLTAATAVQSFTVAGTCNTPGAPAVTAIPSSSLSVGQTYVVSWSAAPGLDAGGGYVVERSLSSSFTPLLDAQTTETLSASFTAASEGTVHHRVKALPACDPTRAGPYSSVRTVSVATGLPNVVFSVQPEAVVTALGERLEDRKTTFTLENIGTAPLVVQLTPQFLANAGNDPVAFFTIADPLGGTTNGFTLPPHAPKTFEIRFQGADSGAAAAYQGAVVASLGSSQPLPSAPSAFVNLKVGGTADSAVPSFRVNGEATEYAVFAGASGDGAGRSLAVDVLNPGTTPMDLAAEIGPELWLVPEAGWNATPIPAGAARTITFTTDRTRAPNGSALPRQTYFTVRTRGGKTARLLVQDNDAPVLGGGRTGQLPAGTRSLIVPSVVRATSAIGNTFISKLRLSNAGSDAIQADLLFTPHDADGFSGTVRTASVVVPANDLVTLTDPLVQLYGYTGSIWGQLEVQAPPEKIGALNVTSAVDAPAKDGGTFGFQLPTTGRGDGAREGQDQVITGVAYNARYRTNLILAETTGVDHAVIVATLYGSDGAVLGDGYLDVPRAGQKQIAVTGLGARDGLTGGQIVLSVDGGGGTVVGIITVIDNTNDDAVTYIGAPPGKTGGSGRPRLLERLAPRFAWAKAAATHKYVVPSLVNGYATFREGNLPWTFQSLLGLASVTGSPALFRLVYHDIDTGETIEKTVPVAARATREFQNVLEEEFGIKQGKRSQGPLFVETDENGRVYCKVFSFLQAGTLGDSFPVIPVPSESLTGASSAKPIYVDGLEQSVDLTRGTRSNLLLNEVTGSAPSTVTVRLYEAGNRSAPIAEADVSLAPGEKKQLSTVFYGVGLESEKRKKDRTNVMCVVTAKSGGGLVSGVITTIDNKTGDIRTSLLTPTGGIPASATVNGY